MSRGYRMRYHDINDINDVPVDPTHLPTRIIVNTMTGSQYTLFTERAGETYGDVKVALLPHIVLPKIPRRTSIRRLALSLRTADGGLDIDVDDREILPPDNEVVLELIVRDPEWTPQQEWIVNQSKSSIGRFSTKTPDRMDAALWGMQYAVDSLVLDDLPLEHIETIMNFLPTTIKHLNISNVFFNANEMSELFAIISKNNTVRTLIITTKRENGGCTYRMNDLAEWLRLNTSLKSVHMWMCDFILDGDVTTLSRVLNNHPTLSVLDLYKNYPYYEDLMLYVFLDSLQTIMPRGKRDKRDDNNIFFNDDQGLVDMRWKNPNV
jgi:hypothetical protein